MLYEVITVDIVETGTTMKQNGLEVVEEIMESTTYLIANKNSFFEKKSEVLDIYEKINAVIKAETAHCRITSYNVCYTKLLRNPKITSFLKRDDGDQIA